MTSPSRIDGFGKVRGRGGRGREGGRMQNCPFIPSSPVREGSLSTRIDIANISRGESALLWHALFPAEAPLELDLLRSLCRTITPVSLRSLRQSLWFKFLEARSPDVVPSMNLPDCEPLSEQASSASLHQTYALVTRQVCACQKVLCAMHGAPIHP